MYSFDYNDKMHVSRGFNGITSKIIKQRAKDKEYNYPPLPNIQNVKQAYLKQQI